MAVINAMGRASITASQVFAYLEANPIIEISKTASALVVVYNTVASTVTRVVNAGILAQYGGTSRDRTFAYAEYLELLRGGTE